MLWAASLVVFASLPPKVVVLPALRIDCALSLSKLYDPGPGVNLLVLPERPGFRDLCGWGGVRAWAFLKSSRNSAAGMMVRCFFGEAL